MIFKNSFALIAASALLSSCSSVGNVLNPFYEKPGPEALLGERNDSALAGGKQKGETAREAFEAMASYRREHLPQPVDPVMQPAVVRLMWIPDHLNKAGDLIPAHYYYLKVLKERWAVSDSFDLEAQLHGGDATSNVPFIHQGDNTR